MTGDHQRFSFVQLDVFSSRPFEGNPLAVFPDGRGLSDAQMQALAREMNLSETTFVLPRDPAVERERGVRVRIFTVQDELPFAGHPTLGTAFALRGSTGAGEVALDLNVGKVPVRFEQRPGQPVFGEMTQAEPKFGLIHDRETVVRAAGLRDGDIDPSLPIQTISTGLPFTIVPLRGMEVIRRMRVDLASSSDYLQQSEGGNFFYFVTRQTVDPAARLHARMLFNGGEDPATGSAAGCATAWMVAHGVAAPDEQVLIEQGLEMLRPSRIFVRASRPDNRVVNVRVGGNVVEVLRGEVFF
ncbi:MAG: PhzF family phenazine biosynthesis protein [Terriglobales bacterium]